MAACEFSPEYPGPLPLLVLPEGCSLRHFTQHVLEKHRVPYVVAHSASGVAGLQLALKAGLGGACLNASSIPDGVTVRAAENLPPLPEVEFRLLSPRDGETSLVHEVREVLAAQLAFPSDGFFSRQ